MGELFLVLETSTPSMTGSLSSRLIKTLSPSGLLLLEERRGLRLQFLTYTKRFQPSPMSTQKSPEPYVHIEPALTPEVLGNTVNTYAGPAIAWAGACVNSLGQGVPCRTQFRKKRSDDAVPYVHQEIPAEPYIHTEIPAEPYVHIEPALTAEVLGNTVNTYAGPAVAWVGACVNSLGQGVPCRTQF